MSKKPIFVPSILAAGPVIATGLFVALAGCTTSHRVHHFEPAPVARVGAQDLEPAKPESVTELLNAAQKAFEAANAAQEQGDRDTASQQYAKMLDLLAQANLDPSLFYKLKGEFQKVVESTRPSGGSEPRHRAGKAGEAFEAANAAQEKGDREAALRHYTKMLEVLAKNDPDPEAFHQLKSEFERVLQRGEQEAQRYDREHPIQRKAGKQPELAAGDLEIEYPLPSRVLTEIQEIQNLYPKGFQEGLDRSYLYLPYIRAEFKRAGLPQDLVWIVMVESEFYPKCVSRAGAAGLWQFMRDTGLNYGLKSDRYVDDRFNWQKSTQAAIRYLTELHAMFDKNWALAVSAYNMGENGLGRAIASTSNERNLWKLFETAPASGWIPQETKKYYPRVLASVIVAKDPERFGFTLNPKPPESTVRVKVHGSYSLAALDKACGLPEDTLRQLNPELIRGVTPPDRDFEVAVPPETGDKLASALGDLSPIRPETLLSWFKKRTHIVKRGETVEAIAQKYGVRSDDVCKANRIETASRLTPGKTLTIPTGEFDEKAIREDDDAQKEKSSPEKPVAKKADAKKADTQKAPPKKNNYGRIYTVKSGDTIENIAKLQNVPVKDLMAWNKLKNDLIHVGDKLQLAPVDAISEEVAAEEEAKTTHIVQPGDSLPKIAKLYGVKTDDVAGWNNLSKVAKLKVGNKLVIRGIQNEAQEEPKKKDESSGKGKEKAAAQSGPKGTKRIVHTVVQGESDTTISARYGVAASDFLAWNKLTTKSVIHPGEQYVVYAPDKSVKAETKETKPETKSEKAAKTETKTAKAEPKESKPEPKADKPETKVAKAETKETKPETKTAKAETKESKPEPKSDKATKTETKTAKAETKESRPEPKADKPETKTAKAETKETKPEPKSEKATKTETKTAKAETKESKPEPKSDKAAKTETKTAKADSAPNKTPSKSQAEKKITHTVVKGDTASTIAQRYNVKQSDLLKWNDLKESTVLQVGQKLTLHKE